MASTNTTKRFLTALLACALLLPACARDDEGGGGGQGEERYTSPVVQVQDPGINMEAVQQAFLTTRGTDLAGWMGGFEQRLNEIYEGDGVVAVDARRNGDKLVVQGFVDKNGEAGKQATDQALFTLEQTGPAARDAVPMRLSDGQGQTYSEGSWGLGASPFLQGFLMASMFSWAGSYFTPRSQMVVLRDQRAAYRATPAYTRQVQANQDARSRRTYGQTRPAVNSQPKRTYQQPRTSTWGGRRPSQPRRTWGGRRR